jgi:guanylate kinase
MKTKIVLVGKAASGKDYLKKKLIKQGVQFGISTTTRPPREGEVDGVDYHFVNKNQFLTYVDHGLIVFYQEFNDHYYGITKEEFEACDAVILNVEVLNKMSTEMRKSLFVIYLNIDILTRMERMKERDLSSKDVNQRIYVDNKQYKEFTDYDLLHYDLSIKILDWDATFYSDEHGDRLDHSPATLGLQNKLD